MRKCYKVKKIREVVWFDGCNIGPQPTAFIGYEAKRIRPPCERIRTPKYQAAIKEAIRPRQESAQPEKQRQRTRGAHERPDEAQRKQVVLPEYVVRFQGEVRRKCHTDAQMGRGTPQGEYSLMS